MTIWDTARATLPKSLGRAGATVPRVLARTSPVTRLNFTKLVDVLEWAPEDPAEFLNFVAAQVVECANKDDAPLFTAGIIRSDLGPSDSVAKKGSLIGTRCVVLDFDKDSQETVDGVLARLARVGWMHALYPTFSWAAEAPRFRVVIPFARPLSVERHEAVWGAVARVLDAEGDRTAREVARRHYVASCPLGEKDNRPAPVIAGSVLLDADELLVSDGDSYTPEAGDAALGSGRRFDTSINADVLDGPEREDRRDRDLGVIAAGCSFAGEMVRTGDPGAAVGLPGAREPWRLAVGLFWYARDGEQAFHEASSKFPGYDETEAHRIWAKGYGADGPPTCKVIAAAGWAQKCAVCPSRGRISTPVQLGDTTRSDAIAPSSAPSLAEGLREASIDTVMDTNGVLHFVTTRDSCGRGVRQASGKPILKAVAGDRSLVSA